MKKYLKMKKFYFILLSLFLFLLLTILVLKKGMLNIDQNSYLFIKSNIINDNFTPYISIFTNLGGALVLIIVSLIMMLFIKNKTVSLAILINLIVVFFLNLLVKLIIQRPRPIIDNWLIQESGYSFPSGHSMVSMAYYGFLIYLSYIYLKNKKFKWLVIITLSSIILFIGISRVYLGVHYLSDVLAGFFLAIAYLIIYICIFNKLVNNNSTLS